VQAPDQGAKLGQVEAMQAIEYQHEWGPSGARCLARAFQQGREVELQVAVISQSRLGWPVEAG
jgi:hypothetical protein